MNAWSLFDPTGGINGGLAGGLPVNSIPTSTGGSNNHSQAFLPSGAAATNSANSNHLDNELIHLSQLMQSLAMHCHKLALEKMCGSRVADGGKGGVREDVSGASDMQPAPPTESGVTESSSTDLAGDGDGISPAKSRQTPRMGLGATSNKTSANSLSKFKGRVFAFYILIQNIYIIALADIGVLGVHRFRHKADSKMQGEKSNSVSYLMLSRY